MEGGSAPPTDESSGSDSGSDEDGSEDWPSDDGPGGCHPAAANGESGMLPLGSAGGPRRRSTASYGSARV